MLSYYYFGKATRLAMIFLAAESLHALGLPVAEEIASDIHEAILAMRAGYFEGDIVNPPEEYIEGRASTDFRWPGGEIPYVIHKDLRNHTPIIKHAMTIIGIGGQIKFVPREKQRDFIHIQSLKGCYSYAGRQGGEQPVSLGKGCLYVGTILHELMHAVGFFHEHSRPDRDNYIDVFLENVEEGFENQFTKLNIPSSRLITDFDYDSVMLYGSTAFSVDRKSPTMLKKNGGKLEEVYKKDTLSNADYYRIHVLYRPEGY